MNERSSRRSVSAHFSSEARCCEAYCQASNGRSCATADADAAIQAATHLQRVILAGTVAGGYVHDINNMLTLIEYGASAAAEQLPDDHPARQELDMVLQATAAVGALSQALLSFVRHQPLKADLLNLPALLEGVLPLYGRLLSQRVTLRTAFDPTTWSVWAGPVQIEQILLNLLMNARNAMPEGGEVKITTTNVYVGADLGLPFGPYVCLSIADNGQGIAEGLLERVFEPFVSGEPGARGTGLGLATCRYLAQCLKGAITVTSRPGEGTTFAVYLPRAEHSWGSNSGELPTIC